MKKTILTLAMISLITTLNAEEYIMVPPGTSKAKMEYIEDVIWIKDTIIKNMGMVKMNTGLSEEEILRKIQIAEERAMQSYN
jgi:hypothetical protein